MNKLSKMIIISIILLLISIKNYAYAHSSGKTFDHYGHEGYGYKIREEHHNANLSIRFTLDPSDPYILSDIAINTLENGIDKINKHGGDIKFVAYAHNVIRTFYNSNTDVTARTGNYTWDPTTAHTTSWQMEYNRYYHYSGGSKSEVIVAHEFGHAYGLKDLNWSYYFNDPLDNTDKLMFFRNDLITASEPTAADIAGVKKIVGY